MTLSLTLACFWVLASAITAMLPMRRQYLPGVTLLILAPVLLALIWRDHGVWVFALTLLAAASMFRNPLIYLARRALGRPAPLPPELTDRPRTDSR